MSSTGGEPGQRRNGKRISRAGFLLPAAALLVPLFVLAGGAWLSWRAAKEDAFIQLQRTSEAAAEYAARAFETYALAAGRVNDRLRHLSDETIRHQQHALHNDLRSIVDELPQSDFALVVDRQGTLLLATNTFPVSRDRSLADRDYFRAFQQPNPPETYISPPYVGRYDNRLRLSIARARRETGNGLSPGAFDGVVSVSVNPNFLAERLRRLAGQSGDVLVLTRDDGHILSRTTGMERPLPPIARGRPYHDFVGSEMGQYEAISVVDNTPILAVMRRVDGFPIYATALRPRATVVEHWRRTLASHLVFGLPATLMLFLLALRVRRDQQRLDTANTQLASDVLRTADRLDRAARFGLVATFEIDLKSGVNRRSAEYMALQGQTRSAAEERHADWVRRLHPDDRERAEGAFLEATSDESGITEYSQSYRIVRPDGEVRWIAARGEIERDAQGHALVMRGAHVDVTPLRSTERALAESDARLRLAQEAAGIGTWEWEPPAKGLVWSPKMIELWGFDPSLGPPPMAEAFARMHPADRGRVRREMALARRTGQFKSEFRLRLPQPDGEIETVWIAARARRLEDRGGARLMGVAYDVTERKLAEEQATLLAHEVEHRAKNALAIVSGLLRVTTAADQESFVDVMEGRVQALARTMTLLSENRWRGASLRQMIGHELEPFTGPGGPHVHLTGPHVMIEAAVAQPLSMALHELTTNAAKYGALSAASGHLFVTWNWDGNALRIEWREEGGPTLAGPPPRRGFGSQLIQQTFEARLGGRFETEWRPEGLLCRISFAGGVVLEG
ncbi:PAS domain-containing protein [Roseococcus sp. YIM B11640]|uniref:PAS domain-containing protein n=1 Tax=Roseococcus sp. YIM B11640 TaxID=3133973 RepID=UPI003C7B2E7F